MKYKIPCTENLFITDKLEISNSSGENINIDDRGYVRITIQHKSKLMFVQWLYLYSRFNFPEFIDIDDIRFYSLPNFNEELPWRPIFMRPYWFDETHRIIPMCPSLAVNSQGEVIDVKTRKVCKYIYSEYLLVSGYKSQYNKYSTLRVHLLVANAWIMKNQDANHPICNHKNGNKYDPNVENLEWVTYKDNAIHAVNSGLVNYTVKCKIRHIRTNELLEFPSVKQLAKYLGIKADHLYKESHNLNHLIKGEYELRLGNDNRPWLYTTENNVVNQATSRYIISTIEPDGKQYVFNGVGAFIKHYNLTADNYIVSIHTCKKLFNAKYPKHKLHIQDQHNSNRIQVLNILSNKVLIFDNVAEVMAHTKLSKGTIHYALKAKGHLIHDKYRIRYFSNEPWSKTLPKYAKTAVCAFDKMTNTNKTYPSLSQMERDTSIAVKVIKRMINSPRKTDRYVVTKVRSETSA